MNLATILGTFAGYAGGLATEWVKQWASAWFARHEIRGAVRAEIGGVLITLNFFIMSALETGAAEDVVLKYFPAPAHLESFQFYWNQKRDRILRLPEWPRLKGWDESLAAIAIGPHPPPFAAIMLLQSLLIAPLDKCVDRGSKKFIQQILDQREVDSYRTKYFSDYVSS